MAHIFGAELGLDNSMLLTNIALGTETMGGLSQVIELIWEWEKKMTLSLSYEKIWDPTFTFLISCWSKNYGRAQPSDWGACQVQGGEKGNYLNP